MYILDIPYKNLTDEQIDEYYETLKEECDEQIMLEAPEYYQKISTDNVVDKAYDYIFNGEAWDIALSKAIGDEVEDYISREWETGISLREQKALNSWIEHGNKVGAWKLSL